ncbi:hypothetical protein Tco_1429287 [Tanacetum coccineum]
MSRELYDDEPLTPAGRLFLQRETNIAILCCLGGHEPLRIDNIKSVVAGSMLTKHPRFSSILVIDKNGQEYWRKTEIDLDRHIFIHHDPIEEAKDDEDAVNIFMADLAVSIGERDLTVVVAFDNCVEKLTIPEIATVNRWLIIATVERIPLRLFVEMAALLSLMTLLGSCGGYPISVSSFRIHNTSVIPLAIPRNSAFALERATTLKRENNYYVAITR